MLKNRLFEELCMVIANLYENRECLNERDILNLKKYLNEISVEIEKVCKEYETSNKRV